MYGVPETEEDKSKLMIADFNIIKHLYSPKVTIASKDLKQILRLGNKKLNQIRPIKLTFVDMQKRLDVLRNNKDLKIYSEEFDDCEADFCDDDKKHKHIYITTDKTKLQRQEEKKVREELKRRRETEPNLIIRNGKIIQKSHNSRACWSELDDGL